MSGAEEWHTEDVADGVRIGFSLTECGSDACDVTWFTEKAKMELVDTEAYGKMLLIDGELQSTEKDEYIYHEMLVHPLAALVALCRAQGVVLVDCQQQTGHMASLGAAPISRAAFVEHLGRATAQSPLDWEFRPLYWQHILSRAP